MNKLVDTTPYFPNILDYTRSPLLEPLVMADIIDLSGEEYISLDRYKPVENIYNIYLNNIQFEYPIIQKKNTPERKYSIQTEIISKIDEFMALPYNWDGYDAIPLCLGSATNAKRLIRNLPNNLLNFFHDTYPNTHGTISLEWKNAQEEFYLEIGNTSVSFYLLQKENMAISMDNAPFSINLMNDILNIIRKIHG